MALLKTVSACWRNINPANACTYVLICVALANSFQAIQCKIVNACSCLPWQASEQMHIAT